MRRALLILALALGGCASAPTDEEIRDADYGNPVEAGECIRVAQDFIAAQLIDPGSAQFRNVSCHRGWEGNVPISGLAATFGYRFVGSVNGKNRFGGYVGFRTFTGVVRDNGYGPRVVRYCIASVGDYGTEMCIPQGV